VVISGILGARLFHVLDHWGHEFAANPVRALYVWEGGLAIWGAVAGGLLAVALLARRRGWKLGRLLDAVAPGLVLAQAVGRVACVITGDAMGKPTNGPFGFAYTSPNAMVPQLGVYYTPMPVYEILANLAIFALLWQLRKQRWPDGRLFLVYLVLYSLERFFLAFTSSYQIIALGLTQSQLIALAALAAGLPLLARSFTRARGRRALATP
jgi:phosphatidylglycerol:prolipoprotein diacylglycerol transferase